jgi:hypothetical protein
VTGTGRSRVIRADVPEPLWDEIKQVVVMPAAYTEEEAAAAMLAMVRERTELEVSHDGDGAS